jgi:uncharacterized RmlC-like cupin family protein
MAHDHDTYAHSESHLHPHPRTGAAVDWKTNGVKVVPGRALDPNTAQTPGMSRATAVNRVRAGAEKLWAGTVTIHANAKTGAHHHGDLESIIFVVKGRARMRWGERWRSSARPAHGARAARAISLTESESRT